MHARGCLPCVSVANVQFSGEWGHESVHTQVCFPSYGNAVFHVLSMKHGLDETKANSDITPYPCGIALSTPQGDHIRLAESIRCGHVHQHARVNQLFAQRRKPRT